MKNKQFNLYSGFSTLTDKRTVTGRRHKIELIMMIVILATFSGFHGYRAIGDFVIRHHKELITIFRPLKNRLPSYSTIRRVMSNVDFDEFELIFEKWQLSQTKIKPKQLISLDGKAIKGTIPTEKHKLVNLVSMFSVDNEQVLSVGKVDEKSNEIPKVQELILKFPFENIVYIMDALHCQKKTVDIILKKNSFYILQVKLNQEKLLEKTKFIAKNSPAISSDITTEKNRGRLETREVTIYKDSLDLYYYGWQDAKWIIKVKRIVVVRNKETYEEVYFITNLKVTAKEMNSTIRSHWKIENALHYVKDVTFKEDDQKIHTNMAPQNLSIVKNIVINTFKRIGQTNMAKSIRLFAGKLREILRMLKIRIQHVTFAKG